MSAARRIDLLALANAPSGVGALTVDLPPLGVQVDVAGNLEQAMRTFSARGGHEVVAIAPDVAPGLARDVSDRLLAVSPRLLVVVFGRDLLRDCRGFVRLAAHLPSTRAGAIALWRLLVSGRGESQ